MARRIPTRRIEKSTTIKVQRKLSVPGEILVKKGQKVTPADMIGQARLPSRFVVIDVAAVLGVPNLDLSEVMLKEQNEAVEEEEVIARLKGRLPFLGRECKSPVKGLVTAVAGQRVLIETEVRIEKVTALISGTVTAVDHTRGVTIETTGAYLEAACGLGGEGYGSLTVISGESGADAEAEHFVGLAPGSIVLFAGTLDESIIRRAEEAGIAGLIVGSIDAAFLDMNPRPQIPIVATEGFGNYPMAPTTFEILHNRLNEEVSIWKGLPGKYALSAGGPTIIILETALSEAPVDSQAEVTPTGYVTEGSNVRLLRGPDTFLWGQITNVPDTSRTTEAGIVYQGAEVTLPQGVRFVPWSNLEHLG
jgi:hypothetical protein